MKPPETKCCPLCDRVVERTSAHHLKPKSRGGRITVDICLDCHEMIHALFQNKELDARLDTIDDLKKHPEFARFLKWISKRSGHRRYHAKRSRKTRRRGRSG